MTNKQMTMQGLGGMALGLLALVVIYGVVPLIGSGIDNAASVVQGAQATGTLAITGNVSCGQFVNITFPDSTFVRYQANFTATKPECTLSPYAEAWPLNPSPEGNDSINATYALYVAMEDDDSGNISGRLVFANPSNGTMTVTYATKGTIGNSVSLAETLTNGAWSSGTLTGGIDVGAWANENIPTGYGLWTTLAPFLTLAAIILIVAGFLITLKGLKNSE